MRGTNDVLCAASKKKPHTLAFPILQYPFLEALRGCFISLHVWTILSPQCGVPPMDNLNNNNTKESGTPKKPNKLALTNESGHEATTEQIDPYPYGQAHPFGRANQAGSGRTSPQASHPLQPQWRHLKGQSKLGQSKFTNAENRTAAKILRSHGRAKLEKTSAE